MTYKVDKNLIMSYKQSLKEKEEIVSRGLSNETLKEFSKKMDLEENFAKRYFNKVCSCGKELEVYEVSMFLRYMGRYAEVENDERTYLCKSCFCEVNNIKGQEYWFHIYDNYDKQCNLF